MRIVFDLSFRVGNYSVSCLLSRWDRRMGLSWETNRGELLVDAGRTRLILGLENHNDPGGKPTKVGGGVPVG